MSSWNGLSQDDGVALVPFFQDRKAGENLRENIIQHSLNSIWADGPFHKFKHDSEKSTDGFREIIQNTPKATLIDAGECFMYEKLNLMFHESARRGFKFCLLLGCDEYLTGHFDILCHNLSRSLQNHHTDPQRIKVPFQDHHVSGQYNRKIDHVERVFYMPGLIRARGSHWLFYSASEAARGKTTWMDPFPETVPGIVIHHNDKVRDPEREKMMVDYQNQNIEDEYEAYYQKVGEMKEKFAIENIFSESEAKTYKKIQENKHNSK